MTDVDTEVLTPDVMPHPQGQAGLVRTEPEADPAKSAIERAAEAALDIPSVPGRDEFLSLAMQARILSLSGAAPEAVRNNPHVAFHVAMVGRDLGISPSAALQLIDVLKTRNGYQLSLSPQLLNAQIRRLGLGRIRPLVQERDRCVAQAVAPDGTVLGETEFTWEDARDAELVGPKCMPGAHVKDQRREKNGRSWMVCGCNQGYVTYPRRMMWWRASGFCANDYFPEAGLGLYSPEELGAVVDEDGRPIDPATVALPQGYDDPAEIEQGRQAQAQAERDQPADPDALWRLQLLIAALPEGAQHELRQAWTGKESRLRGVPARVVPHRLLKIAEGLVNAHWAKARRAGVDQELNVGLTNGLLIEVVSSAVQAFVRWPTGATANQAPESSVPAAGSDGTPEPEEAQGDDPGPGSGNVEPEPDSRDWRPALREAGETVRAAAEGVPEAVAKRIADDVRQLHWTAINAEIAEAGEAEEFPPDSPIDLRRMIVCAYWLYLFQASGVVPGADP